MSVPLDQIPEPTRTAWIRMRHELVAILADDLVAMWATQEDDDLLATEMAGLIAIVRDRVVPVER